MNKQRRQRLAQIAERIEAVKLDLETLRFEEQDAFDNTPESLQGGERGQSMETAIEQMEDAEADLDGALASVQVVSA